MMNVSPTYKRAFILSLGFHLTIAFLLLVDVKHARPVMTPSTHIEAGIAPSLTAEAHEKEAIKAVSVDENEVMATVNRLKTERLQQQQAEEKKQKALMAQAEAARTERKREQQQLEKLKNEAEKIAIAHKKQLAEEEKRLKMLAKQKETEEKQLAKIKQEQIHLQKQQEEAKKQAEAKKLAEALQKKNAEALAKAIQEREAKAKQLLAEKATAAAAAEQARRMAEKNALLQGEVDKYKAMIINAISQQWILPENVNSQLSSQFRIRLAPNGAVLEVSLIRSSGDSVLDRSAQSAIYKASPLPVPTDPTTFNLFRDISLTVRPENVRG